jgi:hypothetical protein
VASAAWLAHALHPPRPLPGHSLVAREDVGTLGRLFGREPRLLVTLPAGTVLRLALATPLSSDSAGAGTAWTAVTTRAVRIEGVEVVPEGASASGRVTRAVAAGQGEGRGEMTLALQSVALADGTSFDVRSRPIGLRALPARRKDDGLMGSLSDLGAAVGGLIGRGRSGPGTVVVGGSAGAVVVGTADGRDVALEAGAPLSVDLLEPATVTVPDRARGRGPSE